MKPHYVVVILVASLGVLAACGLLNAALGASGASSNASTPAAKEAAKKVDAAWLEYLAALLVGGAAGVGGEKKLAKRRARKAAFDSAQKGGRS